MCMTLRDPGHHNDTANVYIFPSAMVNSTATGIYIVTSVNAMPPQCC
jgi:hypothetical protein